jgi:hypothetical protein
VLASDDGMDVSAALALVQRDDGRGRGLRLRRGGGSASRPGERKAERGENWSEPFHPTAQGSI